MTCIAIMVCDVSRIINAACLVIGSDRDVSISPSWHLSSLPVEHYLYSDIYNHAPYHDPGRDPVRYDFRIYQLYFLPILSVCLCHLACHAPALDACRPWNAIANEFGCVNGNANAFSGGDGGDRDGETCGSCPYPAACLKD